MTYQMQKYKNNAMRKDDVQKFVNRAMLTATKRTTMTICHGMP